MVTVSAKSSKLEILVSAFEWRVKMMWRSSIPCSANRLLPRVARRTSAPTHNLRQDGFGTEPRFHCLLAELYGEAISLVLYFLVRKTARMITSWRAL